jgi:hypothetical protein
MVIIGGCSFSQSPSTSAGEVGPSPPKLMSPLPAPSAAAYPGLAWTMNGHAVSTDVISLLSGPEACGFGQLSLLTAAHRLGNQFHTSADAVQFVRDPNDAFSAQTIGRFAPSVSLPDDALFTGYRYGSDELWTSQSNPNLVYVIRQGIVEQWPRARELLACA